MMLLQRIKTKVSSLWQRQPKVQRPAPPFFYVGFHGDKYLLGLVDTIIPMVQAFVETGLSVGTTLAYVASTYPYVPCFSCEPDSFVFQHARRNTQRLPNVSIYNETSQEFLKRIGRQYTYLFEQKVLFWLDGHGPGFKWPLKEEVAFITTHFDSAYILIDDFKVPGLDCFGYVVYQDQACSFEYIQDALNPDREYNLYYPSYTERTSQYHPLRGWGLIEFGHDESLELPDYLEEKVRCTGAGQ